MYVETYSTLVSEAKLDVAAVVLYVLQEGGGGQGRHIARGRDARGPDTRVGVQPRPILTLDLYLCFRWAGGGGAVQDQAVEASVRDVVLSLIHI